MRHFTFNNNAEREWKRAAVVISLDAEQIWGYLDALDERRFCERYPNVTGAYDAVLDRFSSANISATWAMVGGLTLNGMDGPLDPRLHGLPRNWIARVPVGTEMTAPTWYRRSFARRLKTADPPQDVALHGGLTHLIWTDPNATRAAVECELKAGIEALAGIPVRPRAFIYPRQRIVHLDLLRAHGITCYRGSSPMLSDRLERKVPRAILRLLAEMGRTVPPVVWPLETLPGLWNIPASLALYPIARSRTLVVPIQTRIDRVARGMNAAIRCRGIFHYWFHPDSLAESPSGFAMLDAILDLLTRARDAGDIEVLTMVQVAERMENSRPEPLECAVARTPIAAGKNKRAIRHWRTVARGQVADV